MKHYIYSRYEDVMLDRLNKLNQQGYLLKKTGRLFGFEKTDVKVKYNICYEKVKDSIGYQYIGEYKKLHYYYTEDLNFEDLSYDSEVKKHVLLNQYPQGTTLIYVGIFLLFLPFAISTVISLLDDMVNYYLEFPMFLLSITILLLNVYANFTLYSNSQRILKIKNGNYLSYQFKNHDLFLYSIEVLIMIIALSVIFQSFLWMYFLLYIVGVVQFFMPPTEYKHIGNRDFKWLIFILVFIARCATSSFYLSSPVSNFPATDRAYTSNQNYYVYRIVADELEEDEIYISMPTLYYECRNEKAANAAVNDAIHTFEAISIPNDLVDECYAIIRNENNHVVNYLFRKGTLVVRFAELNPKNVNTRINEYIKFFDSNKFL